MLGILDDVRVLELTHSLSGAYCAKLLADQGADTLKIELPGRGDAARYEPPFIGGEPHPERSSLFLAFNTNKRSITLDVRTPTGREILRRLIAERDIVIETFAPGYLDDLGLGQVKKYDIESWIPSQKKYHFFLFPLIKMLTLYF